MSRPFGFALGVGFAVSTCLCCAQQNGDDVLNSRERPYSEDVLSDQSAPDGNQTNEPSRRQDSGGLSWEQSVATFLGDSGVPIDAKFVALDGEDSGPGTEKRPWRTLLFAFQQIQPGDTLVIRGGTYQSSGMSGSCRDGVSPFGLVGLQGTEKQWTTIMGYPGERPKLYHADGWQTLYICDSSYVRISHLEIFGESQLGNRSPVSGIYISGGHHIQVDDIWSHDNGGCGICTNGANHVRILNNRVWGNSRWNPYQTSGISLLLATNEGGSDNPDGYTNYIVGNLVWNNFVDVSIGLENKWGITDGNGIIIDENNQSRALGRTLVANNVLVDNGGPGIMMTRSHAVDIVHNTLYQNVRTRVESVVNNGEIGCNRSHDITIEGNLVIPRNDNKGLFQEFSCQDFSHADNVWVRTKAPVFGPGDTALPSGTRVVANADLNASAGDWTSVGDASQSGAQPRTDRR